MEASAEASPAQAGHKDKPEASSQQNQAKPQSWYLREVETVGRPLPL